MAARVALGVGENEVSCVGRVVGVRAPGTGGVGGGRVTVGWPGGKLCSQTGVVSPTGVMLARSTGAPDWVQARMASSPLSRLAANAAARRRDRCRAPRMCSVTVSTHLYG